MDLISDGLLICAALTAALYCFVLSRRLAALKNMEQGLGAAIATLSDRVDATRISLTETKDATGSMARDLAVLIQRAEAVAAHLDGLVDPKAATDDETGARDKSEQEILAALKRIAADAN